MTEKELDKYIDKYVEIIDFRNKIHKGILYKINNFIFEFMKQEQLALINKGYILDIGDSYINYRKSQIKKINQIKGE